MLTTLLIVLKQAVERSGYEIKGYAPTTKAAKQPGESGIETQTLQKFIRQSRASDNTPACRGFARKVLDRHNMMSKAFCAHTIYLERSRLFGQSYLTSFWFTS